MRHLPPAPRHSTTAPPSPTPPPAAPASTPTTPRSPLHNPAEHGMSRTGFDRDSFSWVECSRCAWWLEGCHYSSRVSGGGSVVLVDEAAEPVAAVDLAPWGA